MNFAERASMEMGMQMCMCCMCMSFVAPFSGFWSQAERSEGKAR